MIEADRISSKKPAALETIKDSEASQPYYGYGRPTVFKTGTMLSLADPAARSLAINRRIQSGNWAVLYLHLKPTQPPITIDHTQPEYDTDQILRILIPLTPQDAPVTTPTEPSP